MTSNSLTENEERDIHSQILQTIFGLHATVIFLDPNMYGFQYICWFIWSPSDTKLNWSIGRTNCLYYSTRVDLYSHQILLQTQFTLNIYIVENGKTYLTSRVWYKICYTQITILQLTNSTHIVLDT